MKKYIEKISTILLIIIICFVYNITLYNVKAESTTQRLSDGVYTIKSKINNNYVLDISNASIENSANVQIWQNANVPQQRFYIKYLSNGYYTLTAMHSNKVIDVAGAGKTSGTNVQQYESNGTDAQQWLIKDEGNGFYSISSKCNGLYLDVSCGIASNGRNVQVYSNNGTDAQKFAFEKYSEPTTQAPGEKTVENGNYLIKPNDNYALDIDSASMNDGANLQLWTSVASRNQIFNIEYLNDGYYKITSLNSNKVLDVVGGSKNIGANVQQYSSNGTDAQSWVIKNAGNGYYNIISKCNKLYMDISGGVLQDGSNIQVYTGNGTVAQKFKFEKIEVGSKTIEDGIYTIKSALNTNYVLDVANASFKDSANIQLWENATVPQQSFRVSYLENGCYRITSVHASKSLDVAGGEKISGTNVQQYSINNTDAQQWIIKDVGNGYYSIISKNSNLYLDVEGGVAQEEGNIQIYTGNGTNAQKFKFEKAKSNINIDTQKYPGYKEKVEALQSKHPNWYFEFLYTGLDFNKVVDGEYSVRKRNLVPTSYTGEWISDTTLYDTGWYPASEKAIAYYMDSRNFLNDSNIFQFQNANDYIFGVCTLDGIQSKINNTYLSSYANDINVACKNQNVNTYYIISRLIQEQGSKGGSTVKMDGGDGNYYYNPFNIGAYGDGTGNVYANALASAKSYGWNTMEKAIEGGITFCKKNWLDNYQNTLYQNKFDIDTRNGTELYVHQYMQNLMGAYSESNILRSCYSNYSKIDSTFVFVIPVYESMSSTISPAPSNFSSGIKAVVRTNDGYGCYTRSGPGKTNYNIVEYLNEGTEFIILDENTTNADGYDWYKIQLSDGTVVYIPKQFTQKE